ncbi:unnamed protein product, partial [Ectocarpus sp. 13 AM-2016]
CAIPSRSPHPKELASAFSSNPSPSAVAVPNRRPLPRVLQGPEASPVTMPLAPLLSPRAPLPLARRSSSTSLARSLAALDIPAVSSAMLLLRPAAAPPAVAPAPPPDEELTRRDDGPEVKKPPLLLP